jgi:hypothetical protein
MKQWWNDDSGKSEELGEKPVRVSLCTPHTKIRRVKIT